MTSKAILSTPASDLVAPPLVCRALASLATLSDALFAEETDARAAAGAGASALGHEYADAVFHKAATLLTTDHLHPLIHVVGAEQANVQARLAAAKAKNATLLAAVAAQDVPCVEGKFYH